MRPAIAKSTHGQRSRVKAIDSWSAVHAFAGSTWSWPPMTTAA